MLMLWDFSVRVETGNSRSEVSVSLDGSLAARRLGRMKEKVGSANRCPYRGVMEEYGYHQYFTACDSMSQTALPNERPSNSTSPSLSFPSNQSHTRRSNPSCEFPFTRENKRGGS